MKALIELLLKYELEKKTEQIISEQERSKVIKLCMDISRIYRKLAYFSCLERASSFFIQASMYENLIKYLRENRAGNSQFFKEILHILSPEIPETEWKDIGGLKEIKLYLRECILNNKTHEITPLLLYGPKGCGKKLLSKAFSNAMNCPFLEADYVLFFSKLLGLSPDVQWVLEIAEKDNCVIFLRETDEKIIEALMEKASNRIFLIISSFTPWKTEKGMESIKKKFYIPLPNKQARENIFSLHLQKVHTQEISLEKLAELTENFSGKDIKDVCFQTVIKMIKEENPDFQDILTWKQENLKTRPLKMEDFISIINSYKPKREYERMEPKK